MPPPNAQQAARRLLVLSGLVIYTRAMPPPEIWSQFVSKWSKEELDDYFEKFKVIPQSIAKSFKTSGVWEDLSPKESEFLHTYPQDLTELQRINISWRMESTVTLMWALGLLADFPQFHVETSAELLKDIPRNDGRQFIESARLRAPDAIESRRSLAELWHWRSRTRQLIKERRPFPEMPQFKTYDEIVRFCAKAAVEKGNVEVFDEDFAAMGKAYRDLSEEEWSLVRSITVERHFTLNWLCGYAPGNRWDETPTDT